ncbi:hypothetical protein FEM03_12145 [Phragmitibacter flavus]|uniref:Uncharacterized protein n=1 Tax=Phragmitibacter flavus TaxID=2576071 RepID=A0A5R8KDU4_9BACT|nr:hypothetical protein [Phragmitibacter flavus]TLD70473.1 hypothetical protein FEM03_12145 [Phragmitibacter flavus]
MRSLEAEGRIVLLSAPRAGHGKTHLLGRVAARLQPASVVAALPWQTREGLTWESTGRGVLQDLAAQRGTPGMLNEVCGGVLATLLRRMIQTGQVPSANPGKALRLLQEKPMQLFSREGDARPLSDWFHKHFTALRKKLAASTGLTASPWIEAWLHRFMQAVSLPTNEALTVLLQGIQGRQAEQSAACLLRLLCLWKPLVLVADHMDGLYRDTEAGMEVARMSLALTTLPRVRVVLSMNQDLWDTTLGRQLPSAMQDRLSARNVSLHGLGLDEATALVELRLKEAQVGAADSRAFLQFVDLDSFFATRAAGSVAPRELLRFAARRWYRWLHPDADPSQVKSTKSTADTASASFLMVSPDDHDSELDRLTQSLQQDAGGKVVDLTTFDGEFEPAPVGVVPLPEDVPWKGSFLLGDEDDGDETQSDAEIPLANLLPPPPPSTLLKLSEMMARLQKRKPTEAASSSPASANDKQTPATPSELRDRFEELRAGASSSHLDEPMLQDIVRLAGHRSALVKHDELELPGLTGQTIPRWTWQGMEVIFGIAPLNRPEDWQLLASYVAGRLAEFATAADQFGEAAPDFKWVVFTHEPAGVAIQSLFDSAVIPSALRHYMDEVNLTPPQQADLIALRSLVNECSSPTDPALTAALQTLLADRLEFFWRRITRPLKASAS